MYIKKTLINYKRYVKNAWKRKDVSVEPKSLWQNCMSYILDCFGLLKMIDLLCLPFVLGYMVPSMTYKEM